MGLFDVLDGASDETLWLIGLTVATLVFLSLGSAGIGTGAYFQGWNLFLDVFKVVIEIQLITPIIGAVFGFLGLLGPILVALLGAYAYSRIFGSGNTASSMENLAGTITQSPALIVFLILLVLLI